MLKHQPRSQKNLKLFAFALSWQNFPDGFVAQTIPNDLSPMQFDTDNGMPKPSLARSAFTTASYGNHFGFGPPEQPGCLPASHRPFYKEKEKCQEHVLAILISINVYTSRLKWNRATCFCGSARTSN